MHESVMDFGRRAISANDVIGKSVLEVGSFDVNGSIRGLIADLRPTSYLGVDMRPGPGVDDICSAEGLVAKFSPARFDLVVSTEMLEHAEDWRAAIQNMKAVLKPGGILLLTTRGPGFPLHDHPADYWRFTVEDARQIFADMEILLVEADPQEPGVFVKARQRTGIPAVNLQGIIVSRMAEATSQTRSPLTVFSLVYDHKVLRDYLGPSLERQDIGGFERIFIDNSDNHTTLGSAYAKALQNAVSDIVVFCHPDVILAADALSCMLTLSQAHEDWGVIGIRGWIDGNRSMKTTSDGPHVVSFIDPCVAMVNRRHGIRFDIARFNGFHVPIADYCLQAQSVGRKVMLGGPFDSQHHGSTWSNPLEKAAWCHAAIVEARALYEKWPTRRGIWETMNVLGFDPPPPPSRYTRRR